MQSLLCIDMSIISKFEVICTLKTVQVDYVGCANKKKSTIKMSNIIKFVSVNIFAQQVLPQDFHSN